MIDRLYEVTMPLWARTEGANANGRNVRPSGQSAALNGQGARLRIERIELLLVFAFWLFMAILSVIGASLDPRGRMFQPGPTAGQIALPFLQYALWALLTPPIFLLASKVGIDRPNRVGRIALLLGAGFIVAVLVDAAVAYLRFDLLAPALPSRGPGMRPPPPRGPFAGLFRFWFLDDFVLYLAVLGAGLARDYSIRLRARQEEAVRLQAETARLSAQLAEARLASLRTQLDPHFLFNTLNAISALVERDPRGVRRMIARLSELLRRSLEGASSPETPLSQELDFVGRYLEVMQIRFQGGLEVEIRAEPDVQDALVPTLILQPLVENAIRHGIAEGEHGRRIEIEARREGDDVVLTVLDDGKGPPEPIVEGVGLRNTRERLAALYGDAYRLEVVPRPERGTRAEIRLPYHTAADLHVSGLADLHVMGVAGSHISEPDHEA